MREIFITTNDANQRLDRFLRKFFKDTPAATIQKWLREKRIRINGKRSAGDVRLRVGDTLQLYIADRHFDVPDETAAYKLIQNPDLRIIYEDDNILLLDKPSGLLCHSDDSEAVNTLLTRLQAYLYQKGEFTEGTTFAPSLANRIDRNTRGIVMAAKNAEALRVLCEKIRSREVEKYYLCLVRGTPNPPDGVLTGYLRRDLKLGRVSVYNEPKPEARYAETHYRTIERRGDVTLCECRLVTGRTHQIRAQFAHFGHPLVGDGKYGVLGRGERSVQALVSYKVTFAFDGDAGVLESLRNRTFAIDAGL